MARPAALPVAVLLFVYALVVDGQTQGPTLVVEPPSILRFSSEKGARADCAALGSPPPSLSWVMHDDTLVTNIPGVRVILDNASLVFPAFPGSSFRQDVHAATYRCRASNSAGIALSREVRVIAVLADQFESHVQGAHASLGTSAVLSCERSDHITVTSWLKDEAVVVPGPPDAGNRYIATSRGDLLIRSVQQEDTRVGFSCITLNTLTGERKRSPSVRIKITETPSGMAPRLLAPVSELVTEVGRDVHILCSAMGQPTPLFTWYRESGVQLYPVIASLHVTVSHDVLYVRRAAAEDSGAWVCVARNQFGEQRLRTTLVVTSPLTAHMQPQTMVANTGSVATFNCTTSGSPPGHVRWLHNGAALAGGGRVRVLEQPPSPNQLTISGVVRADKGVYQCTVSGAHGSAQATAELRLGDTAPELQYTFIEQALRGGPAVSLRCSAAGAPAPRFQWLLDGQPLSEISSSHRYSVGEHIAKNGDMIGHLNISSVRTEDGGLYTCLASNSLGEASHTARLNIYGPPSIRAVGPIRAVAGFNTTLHCPFSGYPISAVTWSRRGQEISSGLRMGAGSLGALHISRVDPVTDAGSYTCIVTSPTGETIKRDLQVVVKNPPKLVPFSFPPDLEEGSSVQLLCGMTSGDRPVYFSWLKDGNPIPASLQIQEKSLDEFSFLIFSDVSSRHSGDYTCVASNMAAKVNHTAQLMVKVTPHWIYEPQDISTLLGTPIIIHCAARGFPEPKITWLKGQGITQLDFRPIVDFDSRQMVMMNGSLVIPATATYNEGQYLCKAENGIGTGLSKQIFVTVNEPAHFEMTSKNMSVRRNDPVTLVCEVFGDNPIKVLWTHNMKKIDLNTYRISMSEVRTESGLRSQLSLSRAERRDSGVYRCQAENAFGRSEHLIYVSVQERPDPPVSLQVVEVGGRTVKVSWLRGFDGNNPLLGYLAQYQLLGSVNKDDWLSANVVNITLENVRVSYNSADLERHGGVVGFSEAIVCETLVPGLHPATAYTVRLAAYNTIDQSSYSEPVVVKTKEEAPMEAPMNVMVQTGGQGELHVTWKAPPHDSWNGELLGYLVTWSELNSNSPFPIFNPNSSKSITVNGWSNLEAMLTGLRKFTRYGITVRAFNGVAAGPASLPASATTQEGVPEGAPNNVLCSSLSSQSIKVSWEPPPSTLHGGVLQGYKVVYKPTDGQGSPGVNGEIKRTTSAETYLHGLRRYTNYTVQVLAYTAAGDGKRSAPIFCLTDEDLPGPPAQVKAHALTTESVIVSWLPPLQMNGRIAHYTVYFREAGRVGKHSTMTVSSDGTSSSPGVNSVPGVGGYLATEVRGILENRLYEFWVSASTSTGEGEPTAIVAQGTTGRAPARIASFGQNLKLSLRSSATLSCMSVGNPTPRTRWMHRGRPVTHSPHYQVTHSGHLDIHTMDASLSGNYTCSAKNSFGDDSITYSLVALLPPGAPQLRLQQAAAGALKLQWSPVEDGGSPIQSYILHYSREGQASEVVSLAGDLQSYTLEGLACGSAYIIYLEAQNMVDTGDESQKLRAMTRGGVSKVPNEKDLISTNSTSLKLNLLTWDNGGCPITEFIVEYRPIKETIWNVERTALKTEGLVIDNLIPGTWYYLRLSAVNEAGSTTGKFYFSTLTPEGGRIATPAVFPPHWDADRSQTEMFSRLSAIMAGLAVLALLSLALILFILVRNRSSSLSSCFFKGYSRGDISEDEKSVENQDNRRNCQQVYTSSPIKHLNGKNEQPAEMYEISPYATFSMGGAPSGAAATLDYSVQFRTFGRSECEALGPAPARPNLLRSTDRRSTKHRSFSSSDEYTLSKAMTMAAGSSGAPGATRGRTPRPSPAPPPSAAHDSESDSSGSPCTECNSNPSYRVPINTPKDMFRPVADSSAESQSEMSPGKGEARDPREPREPREAREPRGVGQRTPRRGAPSYLTGGGGRFQNREEQERREFTIHV